MALQGRGRYSPRGIGIRRALCHTWPKLMVILQQDLASMPQTRLTDRFGRTVNYVRLSVTDRCDFRCVYCMAEDMTFLPRQQVLTLEEIARLARNFVALGTEKIRLTK